MADGKQLHAGMVATEPAALDLSATDGDRNRLIIQTALDDAAAPVTLPPGPIPLTGGVIVRDGGVLAGVAGTVLVKVGSSDAPVIHVLGSRCVVHDLTIELPRSTPGPHDGARHTAITVGDYLYAGYPAWIEDINLSRVRIRQATPCPANSIAVMGAVRRVALTDIAISGGGTGVAVHWGAVARSVSDIVGPSFHPYDLTIDGLVVADAFEGFYLSSVHDVSVTRVRCRDVEIGFRLLPGDNADLYHETPESSQVSRRIRVRDCDVEWRGLYAIRVAGWGRSEVDHGIRRLAYQDVTVESCRLRAGPALPHIGGRPRAAVVLEHADGVRMADITGDDTFPVTHEGQAVSR